MMDMSDGFESDVRSKISSSSSRAERRKILLDRAEKSKSILINRDERSDELHQARLTQDLENLSIYNKKEISNSIGKGKEKVPFGKRMDHHDPYAYSNRHMDPSLVMDMEPERYPYSDTRLKRAPYQNQSAEQVHLMHREEMVGNVFYHPGYAANRVQGYGDPLRSHMATKPSHGYVSEQYMDHGMVYMDPIETYQSNVIHHHHRPSCSCYECRNKRQVPDNMMFNNHDYPGSFISRDHSQRTNPPLRSNTTQSHTRRPDDVNSEMNGDIHRRIPRVRFASNAQHCRPLAGGAPLLTCYNCSELLMMPKKVRTRNNNEIKMRCGACSMVIVLEVSYKNLVLSTDLEAKDTPTKVDYARDLPPAHVTNGDSIQGKTTFSSKDYSNSGYDTTLDPHSKSTFTSEAGEDKESMMMAAIMNPYSAETATMYKKPRPTSGSLQDHFEYSDKFHVANNSKVEKRTERSQHEKELPKKSTTPEISRNESSATEIDLSSYEYSKSGTTFDTREGSGQGYNLKGSVDLNGSSRSVDQEEANVTVNGHLIPHRLLKKAERLAGPVHPGNYWYDFRAGFWGCIGGPCLGIIPPFIEQFNYPLPENCSGGNTGVCVNGRELCLKDLNLLSRRGLPVESERSYIVEISGRILDMDTGEELPTLGKLAPTMEKVKRGFGMRDPRAVVAE